MKWVLKCIMDQLDNNGLLIFMYEGSSCAHRSVRREQRLHKLKALDHFPTVHFLAICCWSDLQMQPYEILGRENKQWVYSELLKWNAGRVFADGITLLFKWSKLKVKERRYLVTFEAQAFCFFGLVHCFLTSRCGLHLKNSIIEHLDHNGSFF